MNTQPLLSIILPTKNRYIYLTNLLEVFNEFKSDDFEVVIQDNSDDNSDFKAFIQKINNPKFKYFYQQGQLSMNENSDLAIINTSGKYICFIGDDDGVIPEIMEFVKWMNENNIESALTNRPGYYWPDIVHKVHNFSGTMYYFKFDKKINKLYPEKELMKCVKHGGTSLELMPRVYHGIVIKEALMKIYKQCGSCFPGPSPDMANAVSLSTVIKNHVYYNYPLIISGAGYKSTGGAGARKMHTGKLEDIPHLPKNTAKDWEPTIPKIWTGQTIWAEAAIKALRVTKNERLIEKFNFTFLYASFLAFHFDIRNYASEHIKGLFKKSKILYYIFIITLIRGKFFIRNIISSKTRFSRKKVFKNVENIQSCIHILNDITQKIK